MGEVGRPSSLLLMRPQRWIEVRKWLQWNQEGWWFHEFDSEKPTQKVHEGVFIWRPLWPWYQRTKQIRSVQFQQPSLANFPIPKRYISLSVVEHHWAKTCVQNRVPVDNSFTPAAWRNSKNDGLNAHTTFFSCLLNHLYLYSFDVFVNSVIY